MKLNKIMLFLALTISVLFTNHLMLGSMIPAQEKPIEAIASREDALKILGFAPDAKPSDEEIKNAYRKLALQFHPDRLMKKSEEEQKQGAEKFKAISNAYKFFTEPQGGKEFVPEVFESDVIEKIWGNRDSQMVRLGTRTALKSFLSLEAYAEEIYRANNKPYPPQDKESLDAIIEGLEFMISYITSEYRRQNVITTVAYALKNYPFSQEQKQKLNDAFKATKLQDAEVYWQQTETLSKDEKTLEVLMEQEIAQNALMEDMGPVTRRCQTPDECKAGLRKIIEDSQDLYENVWKTIRTTLWDKIAFDFFIAMTFKPRRGTFQVSEESKKALVQELYTLMTTSKFPITIEQLNESNQNALIPLFQKYGIATPQKPPTIPQKKPAEMPTHETKPSGQPTRQSRKLSSQLNELSESLKNLASKLK